MADEQRFLRSTSRKRARSAIAEGLVRQRNGVFSLSPDFSTRLKGVDPQKLIARLNQPIEFAPAEKLSPGNWLYQAMVADKVLEAVRAHWEGMGGAASFLGIPLESDPWPEFNGKTARVRFRGGSIDIPDLNDMTTMSATIGPVATLFFVGLECIHICTRPGDDHIDASFGTLTASMEKIETQRHDWKGIGDPTERMRTEGIVLYQGPPAVISVVVSGVEVDAGDKADKLEGAIRSALEKGRDALVAEAFETDWPGLSEDYGSEGEVFLDALWNWLVDGLFDLLGLSDDSLGSAVLTIGTNEILTQPPIQTMTHPPDKRSIDWTHKVDLFEQGQGADAGHYAFYFKYIVAG